jgi:dTMP kinase
LGPYLPKKGCLIVFEGIEGSGKSTASRKLEKYLATKDYRVLWTKEPTISKIGTLIESVLTGTFSVAEEALPLLFAADRADHTKRIIIPAIEKGSIVISDRYIHSSLAYQRSGIGSVFKQDWLEVINQYAITPDLVIFLDISPEEGLNRIGKWKRIHDDKFFEDLETQKRIRDAYHEIFNPNKQPKQVGLFEEKLFTSSSLLKEKLESKKEDMTVITLDASLNQDELQNRINEAVQRFLKTKGIEKQVQPKDSSATTLF